MTANLLKKFAQICAISLTLTIVISPARAQTTQPTTQPTTQAAEVTCEADEVCELGSICRDGACVAVCQDRDLETIFFDFDDASIRASEMRAVQANAECLRAWRDSHVRIEGHWSVTDSPNDGGQPAGPSAEFALASGERRALAVKRALERLGIDPDRMLTISYGIERPACDAVEPNCQLLLRRADVVWVDDERSED